MRIFSDLEGRKEVLEASLKDFELTQQELADVSEAKRKLEEEFNKATEDLVSQL